MPEESNLTHVAMTLQFCAEQLQLCEQEIQKTYQLETLVLIEDASHAVDRALGHLARLGFTPVATKGVVPA